MKEQANNEDVFILGFQSGHDMSYCLLKNGVPIIHEEYERHIRQKEPAGDGLTMAVDLLDAEQIEKIKYASMGNGIGWRNKSPKWAHLNTTAHDIVSESIQNNNGEIYKIGHHKSHAANAFFSSNYDKSLIVTIDGGGTEEGPDGNTTTNGFRTCFTFWDGIDNHIQKIKLIPSSECNIGQTWDRMVDRVFKLSTGYPYGGQAGTVMAMASTGDGDKYLDEILGGEWGKGDRGLCTKFKRLVEANEKEQWDVAASLQKATEHTVKEKIEEYIHDYEYLCLSGGVCLNSVMVGKMYDWWPHLKGIYVCPVPYDSGLAIGSAQYVWHDILDNPRIDWKGNSSPYLGRSYDVPLSLLDYNVYNTKKIKYRESSDDEVVDLIIQENIICVFGGGSESGRRALGNRSILCDPRSPSMKDKINQKVKHRQWFRPFAPSILREKVIDWFEHDIDSPYMNAVLRWKEDVKDKVPAVVHLDGTGRLQTVTINDNEWYYNLIKKFGDKTGVPILLNTSFNDREPIVETPDNALNCFLRTDIDYLYFRDCNLLVSKG